MEIWDLMKSELDKLPITVALLADIMGGNEKSVWHLGGVAGSKADADVFLIVRYTLE